MSDIKEDWKSISIRKRAERQALLPIEWIIPEGEVPTDDVLDVTDLCQKKGWLSTGELYITGQTVTELSGAISTGKLTAVAVVRAFAHRATIAQQLLNPLTEINFEEAFAEAKRLDKHLNDTGEVVGTLHGIPISIKDQFEVEGLDTTMGYCAWEGRIAEQDWSVVAALKKAGAVILTKTNVGHTLMFSETINPLWGRTTNPFNRSLTTGSSSGGEGALIGFHGSPLGFGTDIGGSIRVPAAFCGLYSLRPSYGRVSMRGVADPLEGQEAIRSTAGPMAHSPEDIDLVMKAYMSTEPWRVDPVVLNLPWDMAPHSAHKKFCFAIAYGDEVATPHPPTMRGLKHIASVLKAAGHIVVEWQGPFRVATTNELMAQFWNAAGGISIKRDIEASGEPMYPDTKQIVTAEAKSVDEMWAFQHQRTKHAEWWHDTWEATSKYTGIGQPIDGLISALAPYTAWPHRVDVGENIPPCEHSSCFEQPLLDLSSGTFPTGLLQDPAIDLPDPNFKPRTKLDEEEYAKYGDPEKWRNGPIGLQITARRLEEEKVVAMLCSIREALAV